MNLEELLEAKRIISNNQKEFSQEFTKYKYFKNNDPTDKSCITIIENYNKIITNALKLINKEIEKLKEN